MADPRIKITLDKIVCTETEDLTGNDEFFVIGGFASQKDGIPIGKGAGPWPINNGQEIKPDVVLFDEEVGSGQHAVFTIYCLDKDKGDEITLEDLDRVQKMMAGTVIAIREYKESKHQELSVSPEILIAAINALFYLIRLLVDMDNDDLLGQDEYVIPTPTSIESWAALLPGTTDKREVKRSFKCLMDGCNYDVFYTILVSY